MAAAVMAAAKSGAAVMAAAVIAAAESGAAVMAANVIAAAMVGLLPWRGCCHGAAAAMVQLMLELLPRRAWPLPSQLHFGAMD